MACFSLVVLSLSCSFLSHVVGVGVTLSVALDEALSMALSMALDETLSMVLGEWKHTKNIGRISNSRSRSRKQGSTLGCQVM